MQGVSVATGNAAKAALEAGFEPLSREALMIAEAFDARAAAIEQMQKDADAL